MPLSAESFFVSFSGGADSTALLLWAVSHLKNVHAVHFEHGLRGAESLRDADFCRRFCEARNIPIDVIPLNVPANKLPGEGDEAAARRLRLCAWKAFLKDKANPVVLLGHHAGDVAETLLQRLLRGSNVSGLVALRADRMVDGIHFQRPLLQWTRAEIETFLRENGVSQWCTDCTNAQSEFLRNHLRNEVFPALYEKFPFAERGILQSAWTLARDADFIELAAGSAYDLCKNGDIVEWRKLHPALLPRVLRKFVSGYARCDFLPNHNDIQRLADALKSFRNHVEIPLSGGQFVLCLENGKVSVKNLLQEMPVPKSVCWNWRESSHIAYGKFDVSADILTSRASFENGATSAWFDADLVPDVICITPKREGDVIQSFDGHRKSLKKLFVNAKISADERCLLPVFRLMDGTVIFVPGIQNSSFAPVTPKTNHILRMICVPCPQA